MPIPPNPYPMPGPLAPVEPPNYKDTYPALGLAGLAQGFTHGIELGHEWGHQADELEARRQSLKNEADYRNAMLSSHAPLLQSQIDKNNAETASLPQKLALAMKAEADKKALGEAALAAKKAAAEDSTGADMLNSISQKWDQLGTGKNSIEASLKGSQLKLKSFAPSTAEGQYDAAAQALAGKLDHDLLGRVNDATIKNAKKSIPGFFDTPESKANKIAFLKQIYTEAAKKPPAPAAAAPASIYETPEAQTIKNQYANGRLTKAQASAALDALVED